MESSYVVVQKNNQNEIEKQTEKHEQEKNQGLYYKQYFFLTFIIIEKEKNLSSDLNMISNTQENKNLMSIPLTNTEIFSSTTNSNLIDSKLSDKTSVESLLPKKNKEESKDSQNLPAKTKNFLQ